MSRSFVARLLAVALLLLVLTMPVAALATEAETEGTTTTAVTTGDEVVPAVETPEVAEEDEDVPWTTRFLAPVTLALGVVGVIGAAAYYGVRVASRYKVG